MGFFPFLNMAWLRESWSVAVLLLLLLAANWLPPDTSLREVRRSGALTVCVPDQAPPLVLPAGAQRPGLEVEILQQVAREMQLELRLNRISTMGRDLNPRNWRVTRAQCQLLAGGLSDTPATRAFLDLTPAYQSSGWALLVPPATARLRGGSVGVYLGVSSLSRVELSQFLRAEGAVPQLVSQPEELVVGLDSGQLAAAVAETTVARQLAQQHGWQVQSLRVYLGEYPVVFGMWKGDLTLKRALVRAMGRLTAQQVQALAQSYNLASVQESCTICQSKPPAAAPSAR